jgi:hypothetical protein
MGEVIRQASLSGQVQHLGGQDSQQALLAGRAIETGGQPRIIETE